MGSVSIDLHKKEREFNSLNLSEYNVVMYLIKYRSKVDILYNANINTDFNSSGDIYEFNQELICLYASLDKIIEKLELDNYNMKFLELIFEGSNVRDITMLNIGYDGNSYRLLDKICKKIVKQNDEDWTNTLKTILYKT